MDEEITFSVNDTNRLIKKAMDHLNSVDSRLLDGRIKAIILTNLEQAQLWSMKLIKKSTMEEIIDPS